MQENEPYTFEVPEEGLEYELANAVFNPTTKSFLNVNGIQPGMKVLDVGSGSGSMTHYLARQVGDEGQVVSIDNSSAQLARAERYCRQQNDKNISFNLLSVYDLAELQQTFDLIYCRFLLHHLLRPRHVLNLFHQLLNPGGRCIVEEAIISSIFAYPPSTAWFGGSRVPIFNADGDQDGQKDGEFGMKLYYWMKKVGFTIQDIQLLQPVLRTPKQKEKLFEGRAAFKKMALASGINESDWDAEGHELMRLVNDDFAIISYYQSCQVCGVKD